MKQKEVKNTYQRIINKHIIHYHHRAGFREQRAVRKNFFMKKAFILSAINGTLVNVIIKDVIYNVCQ